MRKECFGLVCYKCCQCDKVYGQVSDDVSVTSFTVRYQMMSV